MQTYISLLGHLRGPKSNNIPVAISTFSDQIFVSNNILHLKEPELLEEMADSTTGTGNI